MYLYSSEFVICMIVSICINLHDCEYMYILLTAGMDMLTSPGYSLMSVTFLQMSGTLLDGLLFTGPACEYLMMLEIKQAIVEFIEDTLEVLLGRLTCSNS